MNHVQGKPMAQVVCQVLRTTDYNQFQALKGNREVNPVHVERLIRSFQNKHLVCPIIVNQYWQIIDGQHRFETAKRLGLHVDYIVVNDYGLEEVQILNSNMSNWKATDYLDAYCDLGYKDYIVFREFMAKYPEFSIKPCEVLLTNRMMVSSKEKKFKDESGKNRVLRQNDFINGNLKIDDLKKAEDMAEKIKMMKPYFLAYNQVLFVRAMLTLFRNPIYSHSQMLSKLAQQPTALQQCATVRQYQILLEDIYNYRSREKVSLRY